MIRKKKARLIPLIAIAVIVTLTDDKYLVRQRKLLDQLMPIELGGPEDAGRVFQFVVSDETLKAVLDSDFDGWRTSP